MQGGVLVLGGFHFLVHLSLRSLCFYLRVCGGLNFFNFVFGRLV